MQSKTAVNPKSYSGFARNVQDELPLASASGRRKLTFRGFSQMRKNLFRTALAKAHWKLTFQKFR
jgi:hypothetical protein